MKPEFPKTLEVVSGPNLPDEWWVSVNGETIPEPQTLKQAATHKPPRSRAKVLVLHTSLSDEWIPVRDLEILVKRHSYDPEKGQRLKEEAEEEDRRIAEELAQFPKDFLSEIDTMRDSRGLLLNPSPEQMQKMLVEVERCARQNEDFEPEEIFMKVCPECFDPIALQDPDLYEEALGIRDIFEGLDCEMLLLYNSDTRLECVDDVLSPPSLDQLVTVLKSFKNGWSSESETGDACAGNRKLAKRIAKLFPELIKGTPEAQQFFNPQPKLPTGNSRSTPPSLIQQSKNKDGKKEITLTIGPVTIVIVIVVLVLVFLVSRCF